MRSISRIGALLREHWIVAAFLVVGLGLRAVVMVAYRPALFFPDSFLYLNMSQHVALSEVAPAGYSFFLWPFGQLTTSVTPVVAVQHLMGLGLALACYLFLLRRGLPRWGAALAILPLLLDPLQLALEQYVLSDMLFEALLVTACLVLLWSHRPTTSTVVVVGLLVGYAGLVRGAGVFLLIVFAVALVCLRVSWVKVVALVAAGVVPLVAYASAYSADHGEFALASAGPRFLYARLAPFVTCDRDQLPSYERRLCPGEPVDRRGGNSYFMWYRDGPAYRVRPPAGMTSHQAIKDFDRRMVRAQPVAYAREVLGDSLAGFVPDRTYSVRDRPASYWLFDDHNWSLDPFPIEKQRYGDDYSLDSNAAAAGFMTGYRHVLYTPGPLTALLLIVAVAAAFGIGRSRLSGVRVAVGLLTACYAVPVLTAAALSGFSWRYQLPQIPLLPVAGALGVAALVRGQARGLRLPAPPPPLLDRWATAIASLRMRGGRSERLRAMADGGRLQPLLAAVAGVVAGCLCAVLAATTGWFTGETAVALGLALAVAVATILLVASRRAVRGERTDIDSVRLADPR